MMQDLAQAFATDRYVFLQSILRDPKLSLTYSYARKLADLGLMRWGDSQVPCTSCAYGDPMMEDLLTTLLPKIEFASGLQLFPTYSYFRLYKRGDTLERHTDRASCEISLSLCLGFESPAPWPIWIEGRAGIGSVGLQPGDGLLYRGMECPHWRLAFEGNCLAQVFLHYVERDGPCAEWKFDKRASLTDIRSAFKAAAGQRGRG